ncbi:hypothetical protein [Absidia glauca]|uniref:Endonuclease/exonuclease/phosphatase domain-containing protein n=1 Tax=Absidia glauca TaxID=4829 RepID=A0A163JBN4_ABSGL|nr:hypothetical protein [Absidia glauca]
MVEVQFIAPEDRIKAIKKGLVFHAIQNKGTPANDGITDKLVRVTLSQLPYFLTDDVLVKQLLEGLRRYGKVCQIKKISNRGYFEGDAIVLMDINAVEGIKWQPLERWTQLDFSSSFSWVKPMLYVLSMQENNNPARQDLTLDILDLLSLSDLSTILNFFYNKKHSFTILKYASIWLIRQEETVLGTMGHGGYGVVPGGLRLSAMAAANRDILYSRRLPQNEEHHLLQLLWKGHFARQCKNPARTEKEALDEYVRLSAIRDAEKDQQDVLEEQGTTGADGNEEVTVSVNLGFQEQEEPSKEKGNDEITGSDLSNGEAAQAAEINVDNLSHLGKKRGVAATTLGDDPSLLFDSDDMDDGIENGQEPRISEKVHQSPSVSQTRQRTETTKRSILDRQQMLKVTSTRPATEYQRKRIAKSKQQTTRIRSKRAQPRHIPDFTGRSPTHTFVRPIFKEQQPQTQRHFTNYLRSKQLNIDILCLQEFSATHESHLQDKHLAKLPFMFPNAEHHVSKHCAIIVLNPIYKMHDQTTSLDERCLTASIHNTSDDKFITNIANIYAPAQADSTEKKLFYQHMHEWPQLNTISDQPWFILGDFNINIHQTLPAWLQDWDHWRQDCCSRQEF